MRNDLFIIKLRNIRVYASSVYQKGVLLAATSRLLRKESNIA